MFGLLNGGTGGLSSSSSSALDSANHLNTGNISIGGLNIGTAGGMSTAEKIGLGVVGLAIAFAVYKA